MKYVLITSAHNEAAFIEKTLDSVVTQTVLPERWVIVDDGSTDRTAEIVESYAMRHPWIELVRRVKADDRNFASKAHAVNAGLARVNSLGFEIVGNLDADVSFEPDYMKFLMRQFFKDPQLGVAGTPFTQDGDYDSSKDSFEGENYVAGPCQLFRRKCFEDIGGYVPNRAGGVDWIAVMTARMKGWKVRSFPEKRYYHRRLLGTAGKGALQALFSYGEKDYYLGGSPVWQLFRVAYRMTKRPVFTGGLALFSGYVWAALRRAKRAVSPELMRFHRYQQTNKLRAICRNLLRFKKIDHFSLLTERRRAEARYQRSDIVGQEAAEDVYPLISHPLSHIPFTKRMKYVLITPAHNEAAFIEKTLNSVIAQTRLPERWVIVDDGSTDRTAEIVQSYAKRFPWIDIVQRPQHWERSFADKVHAFNTGLERVQSLPFEVIGNLDADLSFDPDYLDLLMRKFSMDPKLGVAGTPFTEEGGYDSARDSFEGGNHVAGGCQLFRRQCFEEIGGYIPNPAGGVDWIAVTTARMKGWKTRSFPEKRFHHYRTLGTAGKSSWAASFSYGEKDYYLGGAPLWQLFRVAYRVTKQPLDGAALLCGYCWAAARRMKRPVSRELMRFHRHEQIKKLEAIFRTLLGFKKVDSFRLGQAESPTRLRI
jgi:glycosyltransferase involved in cell wall biosynthesis